MKWHRIKTIILYSWYHAMHSMETWVDLLFFPSIQLIVFSIFMKFLASGEQNSFGVLLIMGMIFWQAVYVIQYSISVGILWDVWSRSFSSLFVTPLNMGELITGHYLSGLLKSLFAVVILSAFSFVVYGISPFSLGFMMVVYIFLLSFFAVSTGVVIMGLILRYGTSIQSLSWTFIYLFQPISALFYPVEAFPENLRWLPYLSPITYVMEALRFQLNTGGIQWVQLAQSIMVSAIYFVVGFWFFYSQYRWSLKTGAFARMEN